MGLDMYLYARRNLPDDFELRGDERTEFDRDDSVYVGGYGHAPATEQERYREIIEAAGLAKVVDPDTPFVEIVSDGDEARDGFAARPCVAYWCKANHIHAWFVANVQGGEDECRPHEVSREQLVALRSTCQQVLKSTRLVAGAVVVSQTLQEGRWRPNTAEGQVLENPALAQELLPTQSGFFFGGTDYDEWYWRDLESTVAQIDRVLEHAPQDATFEYQSSW